MAAVHHALVVGFVVRPKPLIFEDRSDGGWPSVPAAQTTHLALAAPPGSPRAFSPYPVAEEIPPMELGGHVDFVHTFDASRTVYDDADPRAYNPEEHYSEYAYGDVSGVSLHSHACVSLACLPERVSHVAFSFSLFSCRLRRLPSWSWMRRLVTWGFSRTTCPD
jgi:hypothetical protein